MTPFEIPVIETTPVTEKTPVETSAIKVATILASHQSPVEDFSTIGTPLIKTHLMKESLAKTLSCELSPEIVSRENKSASRGLVSVSENVHAILAVADSLVRNMPDYVTLVRFSQTCKLFKDLVDGRKKISDLLFDQLEEGQCGDHLPSCAGNPDCWCMITRRNLDATEESTSHQSSPVAKYVPKLNHKKWAPCYGCREWKGPHEFPVEQVTGCFVLNGCGYILRRCKLCIRGNVKLDNTAYYVGASDFPWP